MVFQFELSKVKGPPEIVNSVEDVAAESVTWPVGSCERDTPTWAVLSTVSAIVKDKLSTNILVVPISKVWKDAVVDFSA